MHQIGTLQRMEFLRRGSNFVFFSNICVEFSDFLGFRTILMILMVSAWFFKLEWCRNHPKYGLEVDF